MEYAIKKETDMAVMIEGDTEDIWIPRSQCDIMGEYVVAVTEFISEKNPDIPNDLPLY